MSLVTVVEYNKTSVKYKDERVVVIYYYGIVWNRMVKKQRETNRRHGARLEQCVAEVRGNEYDENIREHTGRKRKTSGTCH